jgi:hypothetical protein
MSVEQRSLPDVSVSFCGELFPVSPEEEFVVGREGDLAIDDNPYLHRRFLVIRESDGMWWLTNTGSTLAATVADRAGLMQAWLAPGGSLPLVFPESVVIFTAGPTTYELEIALGDAAFAPTDVVEDRTGTTTIGRISLSASQRLLVLALAEPLLRAGALNVGSLPTSAAAAERLGWPLTTFNRKLDHVCQKLTASGVKGLHGATDKLAMNRRARLVEYAVAARIVTVDDLPLLESDHPLPSRPVLQTSLDDA